MKRFDFRLQKAFEWRALQLRMAETVLEQLTTELRRIEGQQEGLRTERERAGRQLVATGSATGVELAFLESFRQAAAIELARLDKARVECRKRIEAHMAQVLEKRRDAKVLSQLRDRRLSEWHTGLNREIDSQAAENHLARWRM